nr:3962_t:CDS:2 [Entrophospora candida]
MNLNGNLRKGQCQPALLIMQNVGNITPERNTPQTENVTPEQNPPSTPEGDLISFDENPPTLQLREASAPAVDPEIGSSTKRNKTILIYKNIPNVIEFYDKKRKWYGVKEDFCTLSNKYYFIKADNSETIEEAYKRINEESEAIAEKTNGLVDMWKSGSYTLTSLKLFRETTLALNRRGKIDEKENAWLNLATTGALVFAEKYEEAIQYDVNLMYIYEMLKKEASWPITTGKFHTIDVSLVEKWNKFPYGIFKATIEGNPPKKSLQCTRYLRYNPHGIYTHFDLECAKRNGLKVYLLDESPNALIYEKNTCVSGSDMFGKWGNILYKIKKEGGTAGKVSKALLVSLWGVLCEQRNGQNYGLHPRIKPFLLASARKRISEIVKPLGDQVKCIHTDGFIIAGKVELKTGIEMGELKFEKRGVCEVKNCISVTWKPSYPEIPNLTIFEEKELCTTNSLLDFGKIQDKEQNTKLDREYPVSQTVKRKPLKRSDINLPNEIIIEIFQHLRTQNDMLCTNNELLSSVLYVNEQWNECATYLIWRRITLYRYNIIKFVELVKKKPLPNEFLLEDIVGISQDIITISFKDCGWGFLNNSSLKMTLDTCKNLKHIFIYGSNRIAPKTIISIPEKCTKQSILVEVDLQSEDDIASQIVEDIFDEDYKYKPSMTDNSSSLINEQDPELTMQEAITWKMIESAQIKIIKEAFRLRYRKDSKLISEYAGYVKNLRNAENQDEYIKYTAITLFPNEEAYNKRMSRYRKWYQGL